MKNEAISYKTRVQFKLIYEIKILTKPKELEQQWVSSRDFWTNDPRFANEFDGKTSVECFFKFWELMRVE